MNILILDEAPAGAKEGQPLEVTIDKVMPCEEGFVAMVSTTGAPAAEAETETEEEAPEVSPEAEAMMSGAAKGMMGKGKGK